MSKKTFAQLGAVALISLIGATLAFVLPQTRTSDDSVQELSVQEALGSSSSPLEERLYLPSPKDTVPGPTLSTIVASGGNKTSFDRYPDGTTEDVHLFRDGFHWAASENYFSTLPNGGRQLHSEATFDPLSGEPGQELYKSHRVYRPGSGSVERFGHRSRDGRYEQTYYFDDGATPARDRYFDALLNFFTETVYRWKADHTGTYAYAKLVRADFQGQFYVSLYREDGSRYASVKQAPGLATGELFAADGSTLLAEWGEEMGHNYYILYDPGSQVPVKEWNSVMGRTTVTIADPITHHVVQQQIWKERPDTSQVGGKRYLLMYATRFDANAAPIIRINMSGNGKHPTEVITPGKNGESVQKLDDSGRKVVGTETRSADGETTSALLTESTGEAVDIDPTLLTMPDRPAVPTFSDDGPPRIYDYSEREIAKGS
jgi:hypothetical protein